MSTGSQVVALIAALFHVAFFYLESVAFTRNGVHQRLGLTRADAEIVRPMALNQGFYNLFLALGVLTGLVIWAFNVSVFQSDPLQYLPNEWALRGQGAVVLALSCMLGAALVLTISSKGKLARTAAIQGIPPLTALILIALS